MNLPDVPSPINLRMLADAREWEANAQSRPGRDIIFNSFVRQLNLLEMEQPKILELGSGPGFLAKCLLDAIPNISLSLLDFSAAMHDLARDRLGADSSNVNFIERDFKNCNWVKGIGLFDAVITNQAVHELRHKRHAVTLHTQVKRILIAGGAYLVSDHYYGEGGLQNDQLYMKISEQAAALSEAGFQNVRKIEQAGSLVLHCAA